MLRRAFLLAALLGPLVARAQTASLTVTDPGPFGKTDCVAAGNVNDPALTLAWTVVPSTTPTTAFTYQIKALPTGSNCATDSTTTTVLNKSTINWSSNIGTYPGGTADSLHLSDLVAKAGASCAATTDQVITVCVQLLNVGTVVAAVAKDVKIQLGAPPAPKGVVVTPGEGALNVSWAEDTTASVLADSYRVEAWNVLTTAACTPLPNPVPDTCVGTTRVASGTTQTLNKRLDGLTIGTTYAVRVYAISEGGNDSLPSSAVPGTPINVIDFWEQYTNMRGTQEGELGGCAGGPAGLLSLLGVAGLLRLRRRQP